MGRILNQLIAASLILLGSTVSHAEPADKIAEPSGPKVSSEAKSSYMICKNNSVVRTIRIEKKGHSCKTTYTKDGVDNVVGKSGSEGLCYEVFDRIRDNLEKASWKCKDITQSRVSTSTLEP